ncbi:MAG: RpiB/LacA/LacB family sugar-phosphate isomerase [Treponema sp.]|jgi:ribose 5-phosphate isomerase B|nr:RpiB/LacA/LacB family sugar-phosphate isomerase [Treponema sp.]
MKIAIGCDPNAVQLKNILIPFIKELGHEVVDYGSDDPIYANMVFKAAEDVVKGICERGIFICGTGIGVSIAANKVKGAYAACVSNVYQAERASLSNAANIMTIGSQVTGSELAKCLVRTYLSLSYDPVSHSAPKVNRIIEYENQQDQGKTN